MTTNLMTNDDIDYDRLRDDELNEPRRLSPTVRDLPSVLGDGRALIMSDYEIIAYGPRHYARSLAMYWRWAGIDYPLLYSVGCFVSHFGLLQVWSGRFWAAGACTLS